MQDKNQVEGYLEQKVNPLLEELLANLIKSRPKNVVSEGVVSSISAAAGSTARLRLCRCCPNSPTAPTRRTTPIYKNSWPSGARTSGTSAGGESVGKSTATTIYGRRQRCQSGSKNQPSTAAFCSASSPCSCSRSSTTPTSTT